MDKERTTREGQVTYLTSLVRRPGYLPALAHPAGCALRFYLCHGFFDEQGAIASSPCFHLHRQRLRRRTPGGPWAAGEKRDLRFSAECFSLSPRANKIPPSSNRLNGRFPTMSHRPVSRRFPAVHPQMCLPISNQLISLPHFGHVCSVIFSLTHSGTPTSFMRRESGITFA